VVRVRQRRGTYSFLVIRLLSGFRPVPLHLLTLEGKGVAVEHIRGVVPIVPGSVERHDQSPDCFHKWRGPLSHGTETIFPSLATTKHMSTSKKPDILLSLNLSWLISRAADVRAL
jgi:hypothetical protein